MNAATAQPIAGVSASQEATIEASYPGIARGGIGQLIGTAMGLVPEKAPTIIRLPLLIVVGAVCLPFAILAFALRFLGTCFLVTNRSIQERTILSNRLVNQISLNDVDRVEIVTQGGYDFHRVGDLNLLNAQGNVLMVIPAIQFPQRLRHLILETRDARLRSDASLANISNRR